MYKRLKKERVVYTDCDDTLIMWEQFKDSDELYDALEIEPGFKVYPNYKNIEFILKLKHQGYGVVIWSAAGSEWAEKVTKLLGLEEVADFVMAKPEICLDDLLDAKRIIKSVVWLDPNTGEFKRNV
jgi:hypothetical protein